VTKPKMGEALKASMSKEQDALAKRFAKADAALQRTPAADKGEVPPKARKRPVGPPKPAAENVMVIRDTFSMPGTDYKLIESLRSKAARQGYIYTKSEVIRAGLQLLSGLPPAGLVDTLSKVERVKPGRKVE